ncbi:hypothetical protein [Mycobacterium sp. NPDC050041]|uniref:hypothetical protein n=1 Tax=Mycobacterium sp. NPDC050041 TaxID=3364293 RepID=UPI003C2B62F4
MKVVVLRIAVVVAALLAGCAPDDSAPADSPEPSQNAPAADRLSVIRALREVDPCALFGDASAVAGQPLTVDGQTMPLSCDAHTVDGEDEVEVNIGVNVAMVPPAEPPAWAEHLDVDGVDVAVTSALKAPDAPPREEVVSWTCGMLAAYPDSTRLIVHASAPPDADACAVGEQVIRTAVREFAERPGWGSTDFPTTVLTGADPCAAPERLRSAHRVDVDVANSSVSACAFTIDNSDMVTTSSTYLRPEHLDYSTDQFDIGGHRVAGDAASGVFDVVVGPEFQVAGERLVPTMNIVDLSLDMNRIRMVAQAIAEQY